MRGACALVLAIVGCGKSDAPPDPAPPAPLTAGPCAAVGTSTVLAAWKTHDAGFDFLIGGIALGPEGVYWKELDIARGVTVDRIRRVPRAGGEAATLFETKSTDDLAAPPPPDYIALGAGEIAYASRGAILGVPATGGAPHALLTGTPPPDVVSDWFVHDLVTRDGTAYFEFEKPGTESRFGIAKMPLAGGPASIVVPLQAGSEIPHAFAPFGDTLYWLTRDGDLHRVGPDGKDALLAKAAHPASQRFVVDGTHAYVTRAFGVDRVDLKSGAVDSWLDDQSFVTAIADGGSYLVLGIGAPDGARLRWVDKQSKRAVDIACVDTEPVELAADRNEVYAILKPRADRHLPGTVLKTTYTP